MWRILIWLRWVTAAIAGFSVGEIKERLDKIDDANKTFSVTVLEGDPRYSSYSAEIKFVPVGDTRCETVWTATYESVGDMGPPEHIKQLIVHIFKTLEQAVLSCKTLSHTEVDLAAPPDAIWDMCKRLDESLPKYFPEFLLSSTFLKGHGEVGSIRAVKIGPGTKFSLAGFHKYPSCTLIIQETQSSCHPIMSPHILPVINTSENKN